MHRGYAPGREILRQLAWECRKLAGPLASGLTYSMEMRSAQGSAAGSPGLTALFAEVGGPAGAGASVFSATAALSGGALCEGEAVDDGVRGLSNGGAISRASTGKSCACCSDHLAARPFSGLFVLYS